MGKKLVIDEETWTRSRVQSKLATSDAFLHRALTVVYQDQTLDEADSHALKHRNNVGFTRADADILTSLVKFRHQRGFLSKKQMDLLRKLMPKYWRQLLVKIEAKGHKVCFNRDK